MAQFHSTAAAENLREIAKLIRMPHAAPTIVRVPMSLVRQRLSPAALDRPWDAEAGEMDS
jgi:hypothetical protein